MKKRKAMDTRNNFGVFGGMLLSVGFVFSLFVDYPKDSKDLAERVIFIAVGLISIYLSKKGLIYKNN